MQENHNIKLKAQQERQEKHLLEQERQHKLQISQQENVYRKKTLDKTKFIQQQQHKQLVKIDSELDSLESMLCYENTAENSKIESFKSKGSESVKLVNLIQKLPERLQINTDILLDVKQMLKEEIDSHTSLEGLLGAAWNKGPLNDIKAKVIEYETEVIGDKIPQDSSKPDFLSNFVLTALPVTAIFVHISYTHVETSRDFILVHSIRLTLAFSVVSRLFFSHYKFPSALVKSEPYIEENT